MFQRFSHGSFFGEEKVVEENIEEEEEEDRRGKNMRLWLQEIKNQNAGTLMAGMCACDDIALTSRTS